MHDDEEDEVPSTLVDKVRLKVYEFIRESASQRNPAPPNRDELCSDAWLTRRPLPIRLYASRQANA